MRNNGIPNEAISRLATSDCEIAELDDGQRHWMIAGPHTEALRSANIDWSNLQAGPYAVLVKQNSQRKVWKVSAGGRDYFAKIYLPNSRFSHLKLLAFGPTALREWKATRYAATYGIPAIRPVAVAWTGKHGRGGTSLLITESVSDAEPLNDYWQKIRTDRLAANALIDSLAKLIAWAHQSGLRHKDLHPGNILARRQKGECEVLFVDLQSVCLGRRVRFAEVVTNLAQLNQWFRRHATRTQLLRFLRSYLAYRDRFAQAGPCARNLAISRAELAKHLAIQADRHARKLWAQRDRRTLRNGKYYAHLHPSPGWRGHALLENKHPSPTGVAANLKYSREQWQNWLQNPLQWVSSPKARLLKDSHTATVALAALPTEPLSVHVICKRPLARNLWKQIEHLVKPSRNMRSWRMAYKLLNRNLPVAQPLAVVEHYWAGLVRTDSVSLTDYITGSYDLETFLTRELSALDLSTQWRLKLRLISVLVPLLHQFHDCGFSHRDFKAPNLLVKWSAPYTESPEFTFIDMDGISHGRRAPEKNRQRAIARFCVSLLSCPTCTRTDRLRFLKRYLTGPGRSPSNWRAHWRILDQAVNLKVQDKNARRKWKIDHYGRE